MKEHGFYTKGLREVALSDNVDIVNESKDEFIVANSKELKAQIYAPEINFYVNNTADEMLVIAQNVDILYSAKDIAFDNGLDMEYQKPVGKNVILVSDTAYDELAKLLCEAGFKVICLKHAEVKFVLGAIGELAVTVLSENDEYDVEADFFLVENAKSYQLRQSGCYEILGLKNSEILEILSSKSPIYRYKNNIVFNENICQYEGRRDELCAKCVDACPTVAILKDDKKRKLEFSHIDCIACGRCVSVCPSGAIGSSKLPRNAICDIAKLYAGKIPLLISEDEISKIGEISLPKGVLPFNFIAPKQIDEANLMTIIQESASQIVLYGDVGETTLNAVELVNRITKAIYGKQAIITANDGNSLIKALDSAKTTQKWGFSLNEFNLNKREIFSKRILAMVGDGNFGVVANTDTQSYGKVKINEDNCTLCLSCVGACNTGALFADKSDNSVKFNASLCTTCNYCVLSCAERDTMALELSGVELAREFFEYQTLARDELFACIECGKEFATKKAVMKIVSLMSAHFADDAEKSKSLFCCADCKAKIMIQKQIEEANKGLL